MMSQTSSRSLIIAAWLMLFTFVCIAVAPSVALAKKEMTIATEGDPDDGLDSSGGGGGGGLLDSGDYSSSDISNFSFSGEAIFEILSNNDDSFIWTVFFEPNLGIIVFIPSIENFKWRIIQ